MACERLEPELFWLASRIVKILSTLWRDVDISAALEDNTGRLQIPLIHSVESISEESIPA